MKRWIVLLTTMAVSLSAAACDRVGSDPVWDRIESSGRIVIGTSADYAPFEYYDEAFEITGFDAAIARELGVRLGLEVELVDIAFEGLFSALEIGQIDAAIAAITVTPERDAFVDFTDVYFSGRDSALASETSTFGPILVPAQLARYRVGVQRGTVYETWLRTNLVDHGLMPASNLLAYEEPAHAVSDLRQGRNDVVVMDTRPADEYLDEGGLRLVGQGLNPQQYALAVPEGATVLRDRLNQALSDMRNDGTLARLATVYLLLDDFEAEALPTPTPLPGPTATPPACYDGMEFVDDVTVPDGTEMNPGQDFDKVWRVRNTGTCAWDSSYGLAFVQGDRMDGDPVSVSGTVSSGSTYDVTIDQEAPDDPGTYGGVWEMRNGKDTPFGERLWVEIVVPGAPAPTAAPPTATPVPPVLPTPAPAPVIEYFTAEPVSLPMGGVITVSWSFSGEDLASATLVRVDPDGLVVPLYGGDDVTSPGVYEDLAAKAGLVSYTLVVSSEFGGSTVATVLVEVLAVEVQPLQ
jgi:polar amino acid transport system substrate-binding protein